MKKTSLTRTLFAAGIIGLAGAANADAIFYPDGTMVDLGDNGAELLALDSTPMVDTTVLGGPAATVHTTTVTVPEVVYVQPNINWDRASVMAQMDRHHDRAHADRKAGIGSEVWDRTGDSSVADGGAPALGGGNGSYVVGSTTIPYSSITVGQPYYVMSF